MQDGQDQEVSEESVLLLAGPFFHEDSLVAVLHEGNPDPLLVHCKGVQRVGVATLVYTGWEESPDQVGMEDIQDYQELADGLCPLSHLAGILSHFLN